RRVNSILYYAHRQLIGPYFCWLLSSHVPSLGESSWTVRRISWSLGRREGALSASDVTAADRFGCAEPAAAVSARPASAESSALSGRVRRTVSWIIPT